MRLTLTLGALAAALALSACQTPPGTDEGGLPPDTGFGNAVRTNIAVQSVNPEAPATNKPVTASGERAAIAQDRYAKDQEKQPEDPAVGATSGGSGGGSSGK